MSEQVTLRSLGVRVYLPSLLYGVGQGAIAPIVALSARDLGASVGVASLVVASAGVGQLIGDLPAGALAGRIGERRAMLAATALVIAALAACMLAGQELVLVAGIFCTGLAGAVWGLARQAYLAEVVPYQLRARAMSTLGGVQRIGMFIGPFLGAATVQLWGTDGAYGLHVVAALVAGIVLVAFPEPPHQAVVPKTGPVRTIDIARSHAAVLRTLGMGALLVGAVRASRQVVIPLWADSIGLDAATTSIIFGIAGSIDMLLFYPAGKVMDRIGRAFVAVPSMIILGIAHLLLPLTHTAVTLAIVAVIMGFGNGIGSGILMTLGADVAPPETRSQFLGVWRLCSDSGSATGPLVVSAAAGLGSLAAGIGIMGAVGIAAALALIRWVPRYSPFATTGSRSRAEPVSVDVGAEAERG
jgi:MFS family permease